MKLVIFRLVPRSASNWCGSQAGLHFLVHLFRAEGKRLVVGVDQVPVAEFLGLVLQIDLLGAATISIPFALAEIVAT